MKKLNESYLEIKKSKFIGLLYEVNSTSEVESILSDLSKEHKKARHIVYAYKIGGQEKNYSDKEPSGTTRGLLDIIHMKNLDNTLIVVIRYFGGILLGSGPLTRTYTKVSADLVRK
jgi:putative IMPACT (imprinted ancient) family translation regulator